MITKSKVPQIRFHGYNEKWEFDTVGKFYNFKNGLNKGKEFFGYGTPIVNFTDVFHNRSIISNNLKGKVSLTPDEIANYNVEQGDIFFTRTSETIDEIGYPAVMTDSPTNTVYSGFVLRARAINIDPMTLGFKQYVFFTDAFRSEMVKKSSMTTRALTSGTAIKQMFFTFPKDKDEQTKIGNYFQQLDKLIEQKEKKYQKLKQFKKAMLDKMFPKNGADTPKIRFKGFSEKWEEKALEDITDVRDGTHDSPKYISSGHPFITSKNVKNGHIDFKDIQYISEKDFIEINKRSKVDKKDILMGMIGTIGNIALIREEPNFAIKNVALIKNIEEVNYLYLYTYLQSSITLNQLEQAMDGGTQKFIALNKVRQLTIYTPNDYKEQEKIGNYFQKLDIQIDLQLQEMIKLKNIKKASLDKMFV